MKKKKLFSFYMHPDYKYEWGMREYGSFEDSNESKDHVYNLIERKPKNRIVAYSIQEAIDLSSSAMFCCTRWNGDEFSDRADRAISKMQKKIDDFLNSVNN